MRLCPACRYISIINRNLINFIGTKNLIWQWTHVFRVCALRQPLEQNEVNTRTEKEEEAAAAAIDSQGKKERTPVEFHAIAWKNECNRLDRAECLEQSSTEAASYNFAVAALSLPSSVRLRVRSDIIPKPIYFNSLLFCFGRIVVHWHRRSVVVASILSHCSSHDI